MSKITATLKGGNGMGDPWIIIEAETASELHKELDALIYDDILWKVGKLSRRFKEEAFDE